MSTQTAKPHQRFCLRRPRGGGWGVSPQENLYLSQLPGGGQGRRPRNLTLRTAKILAQLSLHSLDCDLPVQTLHPEGPSPPCRPPRRTPGL